MLLSRLTIFILFGASTISLFAQPVKQQTRFSSEEDIQKPVEVPKSFISLLNLEDRQRLRKCQTDAEFPAFRKKNQLEHFAASPLKVRSRNGDLDILIVKSNSICFNGAHNAQFWLLAKERENKYKKIFDIRADGFEVSTTARGTYPDIAATSHTAVEFFESTYRYAQGRYKERSCYAQAMGDLSEKPHRIRCSKYNWEFRK